MNVKIEKKENNVYIFSLFLNQIKIGSCKLQEISISPKKIDKYYLSDLYIKDIYRGNGYANKLMNNVINFYKKNLKAPLCLWAYPEKEYNSLNMENLVNFYKKLNFKADKQIEGLNHITMYYQGIKSF